LIANRISVTFLAPKKSRISLESFSKSGSFCRA